jgi:hypothetical protein
LPRSNQPASSAVYSLGRQAEDRVELDARRLVGMRRQVVAHLRREVRVDADDVTLVLVPVLLGDERAPVAARGGVALVAEHFLHEPVLEVRGLPEVPARGLQRRGEAVAGERDQDDVEAVLVAAAVGDGIGQRPDHLAEVPEGPGPAVVDQERHRVLALALHVDEVQRHAHQVDPVVRQLVHPALDVAPVVLVDPVVD